MKALHSHLTEDEIAACSREGAALSEAQALRLARQEAP